MIQFEALYEVPCECEDACDCQENEMGDRVQWQGEVFEPPLQGIHGEECDDEACVGCWLFEIDGPLPLYFWMADRLGAQGGAVVVDGQVVDAWSALQ